MENWFAYLPSAGQQPISGQLSKSQRLTNTRPRATDKSRCVFIRTVYIMRGLEMNWFGDVKQLYWREKFAAARKSLLFLRFCHEAEIYRQKMQSLNQLFMYGGFECSLILVHVSMGQLCLNWQFLHFGIQLKSEKLFLKNRTFRIRRAWHNYFICANRLHFQLFRVIFFQDT